jgi:hypothetical protein
MPNSWSNNLLEETRDALRDGFVGANGFLHMKNINDSYGRIHLTNLIF